MKIARGSEVPRRSFRSSAHTAALVLSVFSAIPMAVPASAETIPAFPLTDSGLVLRRPAQAGAFFDVVGRRSAAFGYEGRGLEAWAWPLELVEDLRLAFRIQGYPLAIDGSASLSAIEVRPEATTFTYSHAAFSVRQIVFAPLREPAIVMLLDVRSVLPLTVVGSFRPRLKLMWPAGLMTGNLEWDEPAQTYFVTEESRRFVGLVGVPGGRDLSVMPYQEEPRDVPARFEIDVPADTSGARFVPIVIAGSVGGRDDARATYERLLGRLPQAYAETAAHYRARLDATTRVELPDARLQTAYDWARVGMDKGLADNPLLGAGLVAGYRTSGESERPGFAWFFGRDALWTALALHPAGEFDTARTALDFLRRLQRKDGKVPHEISQSASLIPWFDQYPYPWNSADATPLYVIAEADHWRWSGDRAHLDAAWDAVVRAWRFTAATDTDGNGLVENTAFGHGWVEGGDLYPAHEEIYQQGVWIEACRSLAELAQVKGDAALAAEAAARAERTRAALETTYWLEGRGSYAFATKRPPARPGPIAAEAGPGHAARSARLEELRDAPLYDEDTVLPAVPMAWGLVDGARAQLALDRLGSAAIASDWGARLLSRDSRLYDPLSYHHGSVWPLFTGWASLAAYRYGRAHVGRQALMANALLTEPGALGYVTELLSGDFNAPFGRSSHHQIWSEAMVAAPLLRGLFGLEALEGGRTLRVAPQAPADWPRAALRGVSVGASRYDVVFERAATAGGGRATLTFARRAGAAVALEAAPALPLDARLRRVTVDGRAVTPRVTRLGDAQRVEVRSDAAAARAETRVSVEYDGGTEVSFAVDAPETGAASAGLRLLRARAEDGALRLVAEGRGGHSYALRVHTPRRLTAGTPAVKGVALNRAGPRAYDVTLAFDGPHGAYARREITLPLR
jgi:glycogen debranching enzyme